MFKNGIKPDTRTAEAKAGDFHQSEFVTAPAPVKWEKKTKFRTFPVRKQNGSGSCWEMATEKERGILAFLKYGEFVQFSSYPYQLRANTNISGSNIPDRHTYANNGSVEEKLVPSFSMTDNQMLNIKASNYYKEIAKLTGAKAIECNRDIETIASTIQATGKGVNICVRFGPGEWFNKEKVIMKAGSLQEWGHAVVSVDVYLNSKNEKCLRIEDSACEDGFPQREVNQAFLDARCFYAGYLLNFKTYAEIGETPAKPHFDESIVSLQLCLKYTGDFPANIPTTENFGPITKNALSKWQKRVGLNDEGIYGPLTKARMHLDFP